MTELMEKYLVEMADDEQNPQYLYSTTHIKLLTQIAKGKIDANKLAKAEMANRGMGKSGKWVGFDKAKKEWGV